MHHGSLFLGMCHPWQCSSSRAHKMSAAISLIHYTTLNRPTFFFTSFTPIHTFNAQQFSLTIHSTSTIDFGQSHDTVCLLIHRHLFMLSVKQYVFSMCLCASLTFYEIYEVLSIFVCKQSTVIGKIRTLMYTKFNHDMAIELKVESTI